MITLFNALATGDSATVAARLASGDDPNTLDSNGSSPLMLTQDLSVTKLLLENGAEIDALARSPDGGHRGVTRLMMAASAANVELVELLLEHGAEPDKRSTNGSTALWWAAFRQWQSVEKRPRLTEIAKILLDRRADPNISYEGQRPLTLACDSNNIELATALLDRGARVDAQESGGDYLTPLGIAAKAGHVALTNLLLERGASIDAKQRLGDTPLMTASNFGQTECVQLMLLRQCNINAVNDNSETALMRAVACASTETLAALLAAGANPSIRERSGATALMGAAAQGNVDMLKLLLAAGGDASSRDKNGKSAIDYAKEEGHSQIVETLVEHASRLMPAKELSSTPARVLEQAIPVVQPKIAGATEGMKPWSYRVGRWLASLIRGSSSPLERPLSEGESGKGRVVAGIDGAASSQSEVDVLLKKLRASSGSQEARIEVLRSLNRIGGERARSGISAYCKRYCAKCGTEFKENVDPLRPGHLLPETARWAMDVLSHPASTCTCGAVTCAGCLPTSRSSPADAACPVCGK